MLINMGYISFVREPIFEIILFGLKDASICLFDWKPVH